MERSELQGILTVTDATSTEAGELSAGFKVLQKKIRDSAPDKAKTIKKYIDQYYIDGHDVFDPEMRGDKIVENDGPVYTVKVTRLGVPYQKHIVHLAAAFLCGNPIQLACDADEGDQKNLLDTLKFLWEENKLDYESKNLCKIMMSETEVAELWYSEKTDPEYWEESPISGTTVRFRMKILSQSRGDSLFPVFDQYGDMIAFARGYDTKEDSKTIEHFDIYTDTFNYFAIKDGEEWTVKQEVNWFRKIPVVYYNQKYPEWYDVQSIIDRIEKLISNHSDTNDYNGSPMIVVKGTIKQFAKKGESGKVLEVEQNADVSYLTWTSAPESIKLEYENLTSLVYDLTSTPNISLDKMQSVGTFSGIALKLLFLAAHLKAADREEIFGKGVQRRINLLKHAVIVASGKFKPASKMRIKPRFEYYLPKNDLEKIDMLLSASGNKPIMSQKTAIAQNPLITDADQEEQNIKDEADAEAKRTQTLDNQFA